MLFPFALVADIMDRFCELQRDGNGTSDLRFDGIPTAEFRADGFEVGAEE